MLGHWYLLLPLTSQDAAEEKARPAGSYETRRKTRYIDLDGQIFVFDTPAEAQRYIDAKKEPKEEKKRIKAVPRPVEIIKKTEIRRLAVAFPEFSPRLLQAREAVDIVGIVEIYRAMRQADEDDIEMLLLAA